MLDKEGFNEWADEYDSMVRTSDEKNSYPFAGYSEVLEKIFQTVMRKPGASILDLGFGTATLTSRLYNQGCVVYGQDYSSKMIEVAAEKMPEAHLYQGDLSDGLSEALLAQKYDFIITTYVLHHLSDEEKIVLLQKLLELLNEDGSILIGDVSFRTQEELEQCRKEAGDEWDDEEIYIVADTFRESFPELTYTKVSFCSGILTLKK
jgi:putative AdoMet-dependent methyltransferase